MIKTKAKVLIPRGIFPYKMKEEVTPNGFVYHLSLEVVGEKQTMLFWGYMRNVQLVRNETGGMPIFSNYSVHFEGVNFTAIRTTIARDYLKKKYATVDITLITEEIVPDAIFKDTFK